MANILTNKWHLDRRTVLRGIGATMALPFLDAMTARGQAATKRPQRLAFVYAPNLSLIHI